MIPLLAKPVTIQIYDDIRERVKIFIQKQNRKPKLAVIIVGKNPASLIYTTKKGEMAEKLGMEHETFAFPSTATPLEVKLKIDQLNQDSTIDGILIQRPLPLQFLETEVLYWIHPEKDVDAFHPLHAGKLALQLATFLPCTPAGIMMLLKYYQISLVGKRACVLGRSSIVGKPIATLLLQANATLIHCHRHTSDLRMWTRQADLLIVAIGQKQWIDRSYIQKGAVVIDVGIHPNPPHSIVGDVLFEEVATVASALTPVPGGVGPLTIAMLMKNTILAAELRSHSRCE